MSIIFFGSSKFVIPVIEVLRKNFDLPLILTTEKSPSDPMPSYCIKSKVRYYVVTDFRKDKKILQILKKAHATFGILASFGAIIPNSVLNIFPQGIINIHPSLLPKYRGPTPVQTAILNGEKNTGVSIIKLDEELDHGPILEQTKELIFENDTSESLYERLFRIGSSSIVRTMELYLKGKITPYEQNHFQATFTKSLSRQDGYIDFKNPPPPEILDRVIRAYYPWPGVWAKLKVRCSNVESKFKLIKFLPKKRLQVEGKKPMSYKDFINGYPEAKGLIEKLT